MTLIYEYFFLILENRSIVVVSVCNLFVAVVSLM